jgi:hypothetical protein
MRLRPLAISLLARGHRVCFAARDLSNVSKVFGELDVQFVQAPWNSNRTQIIQPVITYADLLLNVGFAAETSLTSHVKAWQSLFQLIKPDLVICDNSPTALLAARGERFVITTVSSGFFCPVDESPLRHLRPLAPEFHSRARDNEHRLLDVLNQNLAHRSLPPLDRVTQLYHDERIHHFLLTFAELDHFTGRPQTKYWGTWPFGMSGAGFERPAQGNCVFAYLKPFPALMNVLEDLSTAPFRTVAYVAGLNDQDRNRLQSASLHLSTSPINITEAAEKCNAALTNATHATCIAMLLKGKPLIHVPQFFEQQLFAEATGRLGVSVVARTVKFGTRRAIDQVFSDTRYADAAARFVSKYQDCRFELVADQIVDEMEDMLRASRHQ